MKSRIEKCSRGVSVAQEACYETNSSRKGQTLILRRVIGCIFAVPLGVTRFKCGPFEMSWQGPKLSRKTHV
jgi:hypothetical protein